MILAQPRLTSAADLARVFAEPHYPGLPYYRPVTRTTLLLQKAVHGDDARPFHLFNVLLMGLAALLVFRLLRLPCFGVGTVPACLAAAMFALHMTIGIPGDASIASVRGEFMDFCDDLNLDAMLAPVK